MKQNQRLEFLIRFLLNEYPENSHISVPSDKEGQKDLLRSLMNIRQPKPISQEFLSIQNIYTYKKS